MSNDHSAYIAQIEAWRQRREAALRAPDSWLSLAGLFVLADGEYTIGSAADNAIVLPASAPAYVGTVTYAAGQAQLTITTNDPVLVDGQPLRQVTLIDNADHKSPTLVTTGTVTFFLHNFGDQSGIRIKDSANPALTTFGGCEWFPVEPAYCCPGRFVPHEQVQAIPIQTTVQTATVYKSVGAVEFELNGQKLRLLVVDYGVPNQRSIVLRDATSGKSTYGPARFLTIDLNADGTTEVDFNKAYNPPCAFTPYATCPLPPRENILSVAIEAGELYTATHH